MVVCPNCGNEANYIEQYKRHYCYTCKEYLPVQETEQAPVTQPVQEKQEIETKPVENTPAEKTTPAPKVEEKKKPNIKPLIIAAGAIITIVIIAAIILVPKTLGETGSEEAPAMNSRLTEFTNLYSTYQSITGTTYLYYIFDHNSTETSIINPADVSTYYSSAEVYIKLTGRDFVSGVEWDSYNCETSGCTLDIENESILSRKEDNILYDSIQTTCSYCSCAIRKFNEPEDFGSDITLSKYQELSYFINNDYAADSSTESSNINGSACQMFNFEINPPIKYYDPFYDVENFNSLNYTVCLDENGIPLYFRQTIIYEGLTKEYTDIYEAYKISKTNEEIINKDFFGQPFNSATLTDVSQCIDW